MKRLLDLLCVIPGLLLLLPLFILLALWIKLDSPGPVFFRQVRVGRHGRPFRIYKFRTMVTHAERLGPKITVGEDKRITGSGTFLRRHKLDELPQLLNVLKGDMSLVGPRPEVPEYVDFYPEAAREEILSVRPGMTDNASLLFHNENEVLARSKNPQRAYVEEVLPIKIGLYLEYVRDQSVLRDLMLVLRTLAVVSWPLDAEDTQAIVNKHRAAAMEKPAPFLAQLEPSEVLAEEVR